MTPPDLAPQTGPDAPRRFLPVLLVLFLGSGCAALIYEVVWLELLQLVIGSTAVSLGVLLGTFMGGMCGGSLLLPRLVSTRWHPLRVFAMLELGIGVIGLAVLFGMPSVEQVYVHYAGHGPLGILLRAGRGRGMPAAAHIADGCDAAGDRALGRDQPSWDVVAGFLLRRKHRRGRVRLPAGRLLPVTRPRHGHGHPRRRRRQCNRGRDCAGPGGRPGPVRAIGRQRDEGKRRTRARCLGGACGHRPLGDVGAGRRGRLDPSAVADSRRYRVHVFLDPGRVPDRPLDRQQRRGIPGAAGGVGAGRAGSLPVAADRGDLLDRCHHLAIAPLLADSPALSPSPWYTFQLDLVRCLWAVLPPACLWGASFPLALVAVAARGQDPGRLFGGVYAANTIGAIAGALVFSLLLVPAIGTAGAERVLIGLAAAAALVALFPLIRTAPQVGRLAALRPSRPQW